MSTRGTSPADQRRATTRRRFGRTVGALVGASIVVSGLAGPASARLRSDTAVPFTDPSQRGGIALCDRAGHTVTAGRLADAPFVWKAVTTTTPPAQFSGRGETARLAIYQPRPNTTPDQWTGDELTAGSFYSNPKLPAAAGTYGDLSMAQIVAELPPEVNGLYQLRMLFAKSNFGNYSATYPATVIQVVGQSWHVVQGASAPCGQAPATSAETLAGLGTKPLPAPTNTAGLLPGAARGPNAGVPLGSAGPAATGGSAAASAAGHPGDVPTASHPARGVARLLTASSILPTLLGLLLGAVGVVAALLWSQRRRARAAGG